MRDFHIEDDLLPVLRAHKLTSKTGFVIDKTWGDKELNIINRNTDSDKIYKYYNKKFVKVLKSLGIYRKGLGFHTLRHTFASKCVMKGMNILKLSKILGHSSTKTTEIYLHMDPKYMQDSTSYIHFS
ncbi:MAG: tyrosine-type recombinase/integrase [Elusimicrobia bacterium]|nr:tyrosine-type recombinase/integrase [Candidatus Liberimonas magnetica]